MADIFQRAAASPSREYEALMDKQPGLVEYRNLLRVGVERGNHTVMLRDGLLNYSRRQWKGKPLLEMLDWKRQKTYALHICHALGKGGGRIRGHLTPLLHTRSGIQDARKDMEGEVAGQGVHKGPLPSGRWHSAGRHGRPVPLQMWMVQTPPVPARMANGQGVQKHREQLVR